MHPPVRTDAAMMANTLIIGDSGMNYYHEDGGSMNLEKMLQECGFKNLTFVPVTGGGPLEYVRLLKAFIRAHKHLLIDDGNGGLIFPPGMNLIIMDDHNRMVLSADQRTTNWTGQEGKTILEPLPEWYDFYKREFCPLMRMWQAPMLVDSADGQCWGIENPQVFDQIARTHRSYARLHAGAVCITGLPFWTSLSRFRIRTKKTETLNMYHHGVQHEGKGGDWWHKQADPLLQAWGDFIILCNTTQALMKRNKQSQMYHIRERIKEAVATGMIPFVINKEQEDVMRMRFRDIQSNMDTMGRSALIAPLSIPGVDDATITSGTQAASEAQERWAQENVAKEPTAATAAAAAAGTVIKRASAEFGAMSETAAEMFQPAPERSKPPPKAPPQPLIAPLYPPPTTPAPTTTSPPPPPQHHPNLGKPPAKAPPVQIHQAPTLRPYTDYNVQTVLARAADQRRQQEGFPPPPPKAPTVQESPFPAAQLAAAPSGSVDASERSSLINQEHARARAGSPAAVRIPPGNLVAPDFPMEFKRTGSLYTRSAIGGVPEDVPDDAAPEGSAGRPTMPPIAEDEAETEEIAYLTAAPLTPPWNTAMRPSSGMSILVEPICAVPIPRKTFSSTSHMGPGSADRIPIPVAALKMRRDEVDGLETVKMVYPAPKPPVMPFSMRSSMWYDLTDREQALLYTEDIAAEATQPMIADTTSGAQTASGVPASGLSHTSSSTASEVVSMVVDTTALSTSADITSGPQTASDVPEVPPKLLAHLGTWRDQHITLDFLIADLGQLEARVKVSRQLNEEVHDQLDNTEQQSQDQTTDERYITDTINPMKIKLADSDARLDMYLRIRDEVQGTHDETVARYEKLAGHFIELTPEMSSTNRKAIIDTHVKIAATSTDDTSHNAQLQQALDHNSQQYIEVVQGAVNAAVKSTTDSLQEQRVRRIWSAALPRVLKEEQERQRDEAARAATPTREELIRRVIAEASNELGDDPNLQQLCTEFITSQQGTTRQTATASDGASGPQTASTATADIATKVETPYRRRCGWDESRAGSNFPRSGGGDSDSWISQGRSRRRRR